MIKVDDFNIERTVHSGQPLNFYSDFESNGSVAKVTYPTEKGIMRVTFRTARSRGMLVQHDYFGEYTKVSAEREVIRRFGLDEDMPKMYSAIDTDRFMHNAVGELHGMRVTSNPAWEATLSFIVSQFNNIKRIRMTMKRLIDAFGDEIVVDGKVMKKFPSHSKIAKASIGQLMKCNTGFRAKYIKSVASAWDEFDHSRIYGMDYDKAKELLVALDGVGDKVADCILLMGYGKLEAFPIDVWIKRIVEKTYLKKSVSISYMHRFAEKKWGGYAGYANQYIFEFGRKK